MKSPCAASIGPSLLRADKLRPGFVDTVLDTGRLDRVPSRRVATVVNHNYPTPPCFSDVWQGKDLREGDFVCVAAEGLRWGFFVCVAAKELTSDLSRSCEQMELPRMAVTPTPPGVLYRCENKRVAEKGFCKTMKTKGRCAEGGAEMQRC